MSLPQESSLQGTARVARTKLGLADGTSPDFGVVLGSGLGAFVDALQDVRRVPYSELPDMPQSGVSGHAGELCLGRVKGGPLVACLSGRVHGYEGNGTDKVVYGSCLLSVLGVAGVVLTNAAGGISEEWSTGELMLIVDHINLTGDNPLFGFSGEPRFVDMTHAYDPQLQQCAREAAQGLGLSLREGVYAGLRGPSYETPAEVRMLRGLGAQAVGMSTVLEVIALRQRGTPVGAISCITNLAAGLTGEPLSHGEVKETADRVRGDFVELLSTWLVRAHGRRG